MTYNRRRRLPHLTKLSPNDWERRKWLLRQLLRIESLAVLGAQEVLQDQAEWVLESLGDCYRSVGVGRSATGDGEGVPIFYDTRRLRLTDWNQWALSDRPDEPGSRSWGNPVPRTVVSAHFTDRTTGARFRILNTHLDHLSARSRLHSAHMLQNLIEKQEEPTVLTLDANTGEGTLPYRTLTGEGSLRDSWSTAKRQLTEDWGTFSNYWPPGAGSASSTGSW